MIKTEDGHKVKRNWTYSPDKLNRTILDAINPLLKKHKINRADIGGIDESLWGRLLRGERDWSTRHIAQIIGYLKAEKGVQVDLHLNGEQKEESGMSEWKTLYEQSQKIIKQQEVASQQMVEKIEELEKIIRNP